MLRQRHLHKVSDRPTNGRFLSVDPAGQTIGGGAISAYGYAGNRPTLMVDPTGLTFAPGQQAQAAASGASTVWTLGIGDAWGAFKGAYSSADRWLNTNLWNPLARLLGEQELKRCASQYIHGDFQAFRNCVAIAAAFVPPGRVGKIALALEKGLVASGGTQAIGKAEQIAELTGQAAKLYPKLAGKTHGHHIVPKYLGGAANGPTVALDAAYHQLITNEFRALAPYGQKRPSAARLREIMEQVYAKYPLPGP